MLRCSEVHRDNKLRSKAVPVIMGDGDIESVTHQNHNQDVYLLWKSGLKIGNSLFCKLQLFNTSSWIPGTLCI